MTRLLGFLVLCLPPTLLAADTQVEDLKALFLKSKQAIEAEYDKGSGLLNGRYAEQLARIAAHYKQQGAIDAYLSIQEEISRFKDSQDLGVLDPAGTEDAHMKKAQQGYLYQKTQLGGLRDKRYLGVMLKIIDRIDGLEKEFKRLSNEPGAEELDAFRLDFLGDPDLTLARKREEDRKNQVAQRPVPAKKNEAKQRVSSGTKVIDIRGYRLSSEWTPVLIEIKPGDKVSIEAAGSWKCPGTSGEIGPEGHTERYFSSTYKQYKDLPYGALLYRFAGRAKPVNSRVEFTAKEEGRISLDSNVKSDKSFRRNGKGSVKVVIRVEHTAEEE